MTFTRRATIVPIPEQFNCVRVEYTASFTPCLTLEDTVEAWCRENLRGHWGAMHASGTLDDNHPDFRCLYRMWFEHYDDAAFFKMRWFV